MALRLQQALAVALCSLAPGSAAETAILQLQILEGEGAVHIAGVRSLRPVSVQVTDETGKPVEGAAKHVDVRALRPDRRRRGIEARMEVDDLFDVGRHDRLSPPNVACLTTRNSAGPGRPNEASTGHATQQTDPRLAARRLDHLESYCQGKAPNREPVAATPTAALAGRRHCRHHYAVGNSPPTGCSVSGPQNQAPIAEERANSQTHSAGQRGLGLTAKAVGGWRPSRAVRRHEVETEQA